MSVVDMELRVHGIEGLRVIDATVMPAVTSTNTQRADHHDRRKGRRDDQRRRAAKTGGVAVAGGSAVDQKDPFVYIQTRDHFPKVA